MALLPVGPDPRWRPAAILENFEWPYISNGLLDSFRVSSTVGLVISAARKDRAFKFYTDLGTEEHNTICSHDVP